ncbi:PD40 domain-containing protein [bacterium]|nr:PD40 domain-containing protein [bacterium]
MMETIFSVAILGVLLALVGLQWRTPRSGASTRALAESLAELLRGARVRALAEGMPVGVGFANFPYTQTVDVYAGLPIGQRQRTYYYGGEFPGTYLFCGDWDSTPAAATGPIVLGCADDNFDSAGWAAGSSDPQLIFTPHGQVASRSIPHFGGDYHVVISQGLEVAQNRLQRSHKAYTLCVSATGSVRVERGVAGASLAEADHPLGGPNPTWQPRGPVAGNSNPTITTVKVHPEPHPDNLPPGHNTLIHEGESLTLEASASDPEGQALSVEWSATGGSFSHSDQLPMSWDKTSQAWKAAVTWQPPTPVGSGDFEIHCTVRDGHGGVAQAMRTATPKVATNQPFPVLFHRYDWQHFRSRVWVIGSDGSGEKALSEFNNSDMSIMSGDGRRICYAEGSNYHIMNSDGSDDQIISAASFPADSSLNYNAAWSPDCAHLALMDSTGPGERMIVVNAASQPTNPVVVFDAGPGRQVHHPAWSADGQKLALASNRDSTDSQLTFDLYVLEFQGSTTPFVRQLTSGGKHDTRPVFSRDGSVICFGSSDGVYTTCLINSDGTGVPRPLFVGQGGITPTPKFSANGLRALTCDSNGCWSVSTEPPYPDPSPAFIHTIPVKGMSFGPDDRVYFAAPQGTNRSVVSTDSRGQNPRQLTRNENDLTHGRWGPVQTWW